MGRTIGVGIIIIFAVAIIADSNPREPSPVPAAAQSGPLAQERAGAGVKPSAQERIGSAVYDFGRDEFIAGCMETGQSSRSDCECGADYVMSRMTEADWNAALESRMTPHVEDLVYEAAFACYD